MSGDPRFQIRVCEHLFRKAHERARRTGMNTSDWLRHILMQWDGELVEQRVKQLSVRLDRSHVRRLERLAQQTGKTRTRAFALLVEQALDVTEESGPARRPERKSAPARAKRPARAHPTMPSMDDYETWADVILQAARATPHKFGERKAFISGVIDELGRRYQPADRTGFEAMIKQLLLQLNQMDLVPLVRADLVSVMDIALVEASEIRKLNATFHFVDLTRFLPASWSHAG